MIKKIDKMLLSDVDVCDINAKKICIVKFRNLDAMNDYIKEENRVCHVFSCIKSVVIELGVRDVYDVAKKDSVIYISSVPKVCAMVNVAKEIIGVKNDIKNNSNFSVAIIDTGIYPHIDFLVSGRNRIVRFLDMVSSKNVIYDDNGHGTAIAGVLAGSGIVSDKKYAGVDNNTDIVVIKALDNNGETNALNILKSMQWVYDNAVEYNIRVVCMSFGSNPIDSNDPLIAGAEALWDKGIVVVTACGNSGPDFETIKSPSASPKVISVGAMDDNRIGDEFNTDNFEVADFSSRGPALGNYKPDLVVSGVGVMTTSNYGLSKKFYDRITGTSIATPIVAGVVCRLIRMYPKHTPDQIKNILINNCVHITGDRNIEGHGWLNLDKIFS